MSQTSINSNYTIVLNEFVCRFILLYRVLISDYLRSKPDYQLFTTENKFGFKADYDKSNYAFFLIF